MSHAGLRSLLRGLLSWPRRYRPLCCPGKGGHVHRGMTAGERAVWAEKIEAATLVVDSSTLVSGVREMGCDFWTVDEESAA